MGVLLSVVWLISWLLMGTFAFLAGKTGKRKYLVFAVLSVMLMYASVTFLGWT